MRTIPKRSFGKLKPEVPSHPATTTQAELKFDCLECGKSFIPYYNDEGLITSVCPNCYLRQFGEPKESIDYIPKTEYIPKSERLLAIYDMLTDKSFPRKGKGKSTKPKILDAIVMAATDLKLRLQGAYDD